MVQQIKAGVAWMVGGQAEVEWIAEGTGSGPQITTAIPPRYAAYATLANAGAPDLPPRYAPRASPGFRVCRRAAPPQRDDGVVAGYLDTGASDIVFWDVMKVTVYCGWEYASCSLGQTKPRIGARCREHDRTGRSPSCPS